MQSANGCAFPKGTPWAGFQGNQQETTPCWRGHPGLARANACGQETRSASSGCQKARSPCFRRRSSTCKQAAKHLHHQVMLKYSCDRRTALENEQNIACFSLQNLSPKCKPRKCKRGRAERPNPKRRSFGAKGARALPRQSGKQHS